ncbi:MAG TPA: acetyl-CoA synthetase [Dehalococcoidia bacterium]|nr:acetyl-CoA synthetase [Dehalococcoidia bacterium]
MSLSTAMNLNQQLDCLFDPRSVAVIGASSNMVKWGFHILNLLLVKGGREVYAINRNEPEVLGLKTYRSVADVPGPVDVAVITVVYHDIPAVMEDCVQKGVKGAVIISGGLAETGEEGARVEREVVEIARRGGIRLVGPNCMGHFDTSSGLYTVPYLPPSTKGTLSLIAQSGNASQAIVHAASERGLGFSKYISSGNEADLHFEDYLEYLAQDEQTEIILGYVEGFREGRRFFELAKEITKKKPVVILKAGRTEAGKKAAQSHTASLAGSDAICEAAFKQCGVIRVADISELIDVALALVGQPLPRGRRVAVFSTGGGPAVMAADALMRHGLELPELSPKTMDKLNATFTPRWSRSNPIESGGDPFDHPCLWAVLEDDNIDAALIINAVAVARNYAWWVQLPPSLNDAIEQYIVAEEETEVEHINNLLELMHKYQKPVMIANIGIPSAREGVVYDRLEQTHLVPYLTQERAAGALAHLVEYSEYLGVARGNG